jgi:taurine dioxygenase
MPVLDLKPLSPALGVEVLDLEPAAPLQPTVTVALRDALLAHQLLLFRDKSLTADQQVAFAEAFGRVRTAWQRDNYPCENPKAHYLTNMNVDGEIVPARRERSASFWHGDGSWQRRPARATMLNALHVPSSGGDTHFANMYLVYEGLDADTRAALHPLRAEHDVELSRAARDGGWPWQWNWREPSETAQRKPLRFWAGVLAQRLREPAIAHPVVLRHPDTGRECLFVGDHAWRIKSMPLWSGIRRMRAINALPIDERHVYTHRWRPGDLLVWDNLCVLHRADAYDVLDEKRLLRRCVILEAESDGSPDG